MNELVDILLKLCQDAHGIRVQLDQMRTDLLLRNKSRWVKGDVVLEILGISKRTLQKLRDEELLPCSKIKGTWYYKVADIENLLNSNYQTPKSKKNGPD
ncbi:MAG: helix-turn-helix domain-containing protein [Bacteroidia bacterium]